MFLLSTSEVLSGIAGIGEARHTDSSTLEGRGTIGEHWKEIEGAYLKEDWKSVNQMLEKYSREKYEER